MYMVSTTLLVLNIGLYDRVSFRFRGRPRERSDRRKNPQRPPPPEGLRGRTLQTAWRILRSGGTHQPLWPGRSHAPDRARDVWQTANAEAERSDRSERQPPATEPPTSRRSYATRVAMVSLRRATRRWPEAGVSP